MMEQVSLGAVWAVENWLSFSLNQIQGWATVRESYSRALEQGALDKSGDSPTASEREYFGAFATKLWP